MDRFWLLKIVLFLRIPYRTICSCVKYSIPYRTGFKNHPRSKFFHPGYWIKGQSFRIPDLDLHERIKVFLTQKIVSNPSEIWSGIFQCCGSGSGIRDWVLFDPWIRDPE